MQGSDVMTSIQTCDITQSHDRACDGMWTYAHLQDIYIDKQEDDWRDQSIEDSEMWLTSYMDSNQCPVCMGSRKMFSFLFWLFSLLVPDDPTETFSAVAPSRQKDWEEPYMKWSSLWSDLRSDSVFVSPAWCSGYHSYLRNANQPISQEWRTFTMVQLVVPSFPSKIPYLLD